MNILERLRTEHGFNKVEMAKRLGIGKSYYSMLENEDRVISKNVGIKLHKEFGLPLEEIFFNSRVHRRTTTNSH